MAAGDAKWHPAREVCAACEFCNMCENFSQNLAHIADLARIAAMARRTPASGWVRAITWM